MPENRDHELSRRALLGGVGVLLGGAFGVAGATAAQAGTAGPAAPAVPESAEPPDTGTATPQPPGGDPDGDQSADSPDDQSGVSAGETIPELLAVPLVHTRREWQAMPPRHRAPLLPHGPDHIVIHHTDTPNADDLSLAHAFLLSRQIQAFHMNGRGWDDIGEQLTISRGGHIMEGRNGSLPAIHARKNVLGAQTLHHNDHTLGIENEGSYMTAPVPGTLWRSLVRTCTWLCSQYGLDPQRAIVGHRDYMSTDCPGDVLYRRLPELRGSVAAALARDRLARAPRGSATPLPGPATPLPRPGVDAAR